MYYHIQQRWVAALFAAILGLLIAFESIVVSAQALAILVLSFSFVLWYDFFSSVLMLRHERKMAQVWNEIDKEDTDKIVSDLLMHNKEYQDKNDTQTEPWSGQ